MYTLRMCPTVGGLYIRSTYHKHREISANVRVRQTHPANRTAPNTARNAVRITYVSGDVRILFTSSSSTSPLDGRFRRISESPPPPLMGGVSSSPLVDETSSSHGDRSPDVVDGTTVAPSDRVDESFSLLELICTGLPVDDDGMESLGTLFSSSSESDSS